MPSHMSALTRSTRAAGVIAASVEQMTGTYTARISSVRAGKVYVILPTYDTEREFGPCIVPVGVQGVGPVTATYHVGSPPTVTTAVANAIPLVKGLLVLVQFPESGHPWLLAIAPTGT